MSTSVLVCAQDGLPVHGVAGVYRHSLGGKTGAIPASKKHKPVPVLRTDYDRAYDISTPPEMARMLLARFRAANEEINGG